MTKIPTKPSDKKRIEFSPAVKQTLFKQTDGKCSVPRCKNPAMGPYHKREGAVNMGTACHIYSAAENGPRGQGGKDKAFIKSEKNGIWCCTYHGSLIDKAKGIDYLATDLFAWKALAEARVRKQMNDIPSPLGWVESIEFTSFPRFEKSLPQIKLSRWTLMYGENHGGKTSLLEAAASVSHSKYAEGFDGLRSLKANNASEPAKFNAKITYSTVDTFSKELNIEIEGNKITRSVSGTPHLLPPGDLEVIYLDEKDLRRLASEDDIDYMLRVLNVDKSALLALAQMGAKTLCSGEIKFEQAKDWDDAAGEDRLQFKDNNRPYYQLSFKFSSKSFYTPFCALSEGEQSRLILDLLISKTREISKQRLTLLLIENLIVNFDEKNFANLLTALSKEDFQTIVSLPHGMAYRLLEKKPEGYVLKDQDYLDSWRLAVVENN